MLFTAAILGIFVYGMIAAMLGTILPDLSKKYSLSPKQNGNIALIQAIGLMIGSFFSGPLMDLYGKQVGMLLGLGLVALALLSLRSVRGYSLVASTMLLLGLGGGVHRSAGCSHGRWQSGAGRCHAQQRFVLCGARHCRRHTAEAASAWRCANALRQSGGCTGSARRRTG